MFHFRISASQRRHLCLQLICELCVKGNHLGRFYVTTRRFYFHAETKQLSQIGWKVFVFSAIKCQREALITLGEVAL